MSKHNTPNGNTNGSTNATQPERPSIAPTGEERRSEFRLLSRIMHTAPDDECEFLVRFLESCADRTRPDRVMHTIPELALAEASAHFNLTISVEDLEDEAKFYRGLRYVLVRGGWLKSFIRIILSSALDGYDVTPDMVAAFLDQEMAEIDSAVSTAREVLRNSPARIAADIRKAVAAHPELFV
jgi:hypothetical protein